MMMKNNIITVLILLLTVYQVRAQEVYTLEKCKQMAIENNAKAKNSRLAVEAATQTKKEAFTRYFPEISATGIGMMNEKPLLTTTVQTGNPDQPTAEVGMIKNGIIGAVMAMQPLFVGGQIVNGNRLAKAGLEVSRLQQQLSDDEVLLKTEQYYWQLVSMKEKLKTIAEAETLLARVRHDVSLAVEAGLTVKTDLLRIELEQNKLQRNRLKAENGLALLKMSMVQHIGAPSDAFDVAPLPSDALPQPAEYFVNHNDALPQLATYRLLEKSVNVAELQVKMKIGETLPMVAVGATYNYMKFDGGKPTEMKDNFGMLLATVSVPISGWWGGSHAIKKKRLEVQQAINTRQETEDLLLTQMQHLRNAVTEAYQQTLLAQESIAVAEENVRQNEDHYKAGVSILSDLLDAQSLLQQTRDQYTEAATGYFMKLSEYKKATGR
ncbi:MAG: TolC family protein [Prevotellaceae bacterium]|jgi:outer membrane protein TolC|nr:TolC family protein [Prevotellaceae bacterium]